MNIIVNDQPITLSAPITIGQLLEHIQRTQTGIALAINQAIIPRSEWHTHHVNDGDSILLFQAIAGG
ncbi:sulfur carrier protein ThiS [Xenorhabdus koppenhoeferi]|uniref:Sulfur carrier protein ThiS n=1 Tax=Xenorhabdus koppenhoeferi TaxID=351659 RepID=A0A1I7IWT0_9GAMM|nr:sulfur carrier protein ThiS [Xenorhabdus koppenhoeferi]SFU77301.1 sulfur carrier protein ThiS [Xenorhabdus koppenhoeferi]